jgi:hypothetical protein
MGRGKNNRTQKALYLSDCMGYSLKHLIRMKAILQKEFDKPHRQGGKPAELTVQDNLFIT